MSELRAHIGLGGNVGDATATLRAAVHALTAMPGVRLAGVSRLFATAPVGVTRQAEFRNAVVALDVPAGPDPDVGALALLLALKGTERAFGRGTGVRWGPRELDLDLLLFGPHRIRVQRPPEARSEDPARPQREWLEVPHAAAAERLFVLAPLADLDPRLVPPGWPDSVGAAEARRRVVEGPAAVRPVAHWSFIASDWIPSGGHAPSRGQAPSRGGRSDEQS